MLKAILFDLDLTLVNTYDMWMEVLKHLNYNNLKTDKVHKKENWGNTHEEFAREIGKMNGVHWTDISSTTRKFIKNHRGLEFREKYFLRRLKRNAKIGIITGNSKPITDIFLEKNPDIKFDIVMTTDDLQAGETKKELIIRAVEKLDIEPTDAAYVGDHPNDIIASKKAGVMAIAITSRLHNREELTKYNPDMVIDKISEIGDILF